MWEGHVHLKLYYGLEICCLVVETRHSICKGMIDVQHHKTHSAINITKFIECVCWGAHTTLVCMCTCVKVEAKINLCYSLGTVHLIFLFVCFEIGSFFG